MRAYPIELRQRIVDAYLHREGSIRQVAERFQVARSYVQTLLKQYRERGHVRPLGSHTRRGKPPILQDHEALVRELVAQHNDATLSELCQMIETRTGLRVAQSTLHRCLARLQLTRKKNSRPVKRPRHHVSNNAVSIGSK